MPPDARTLKEIRKLADAALGLVEKGKHDKALKKYLELEQLDTEEASWSKRVADCHRRLGRRQDELQALMRAADGYSRTGFLLKAVAMCKLVLAIEPNHTETLERLARLHATQTTGLDRFQRAGGLPSRGAPDRTVQAASAVGTVPASTAIAIGPDLPEPPPPEPRIAAEPAPVAEDRERVVSDLPLASVELHKVLDSHLRGDLPTHSSGIYELDLDEVEYLDESAAGAERSPPEPAAAATAERARQAATQLLPRTPLFSDVGEESLLRLISRVTLRELEAGELVCHQGDPADSLYVVAEGAVEVLQDGSPAISLAVLGEGEFFGEIGLISDTPSQRTVIAHEPTQLLVIDRAVVNELRDAEPGFLKVLLRFLRFRLIAPLMETSPLFAPFSIEERKEMAKKFQFLELEAGAVIVEEGKRASGLFLLLSGAAEVVRGESESLAVLRPGDIFGEMSLLTGNPAMASVRVTQKAFALEMPAARFTETVMVNPQVLMYVSELADQRRRQNESMPDGCLEFR